MHLRYENISTIDIMIIDNLERNNCLSNGIYLEYLMTFLKLTSWMHNVIGIKAFFRVAIKCVIDMLADLSVCLY